MFPAKNAGSVIADIGKICIHVRMVITFVLVMDETYSESSVSRLNCYVT